MNGNMLKERVFYQGRGAMIWNGNVILKTHKTTAKSCDHWAFEKMTSLHLNAFQGKQYLYRESWILIKAKKWSECDEVPRTHSGKIWEGRKFDSEVRHREIWRWENGKDK